MDNSKKTRKALLASVMALALCFVMLIGTTFAWFTDTATTGVNKIQAGNLDVDLEMKDAEGKWVSAEGKTLNFVKAPDAPEKEKILWEPGCTYNLPELRVVNNGNLALKYKVVITGIKGDAKLNEAIEWTITGTKDGTLSADAESGVISIVGHMKEYAGNEYQGLSIDGIAITVYATQLNSEFDSINNTYDTDATYLNKDADGNWLISNADELIYFARTVNVEGTSYADKTVKLTNDIDLNNKYWTPIKTGNWGMTFDGNGKTISNLNVTGEKNVGLFGNFTGNTAKNLTIDGANVVGINHVAAIAGDGLCAHFENCTVKNATITTAVKNSDDGDKAGAICGYLSAEPNASVNGCTVEDCTIEGYRDVGAVVGYANGASVVIGNTAKNVTLINNRLNNYKNYTTDAAFDVNEVVGEAVAAATVSGNTASDVNIVKKLGVGTATDLQAMLNTLTSSGASDNIIEITNDINIGTATWVPAYVHGYTGAGVIIVNGNGHKVTGLNAPLLDGGFAGDSGVIINDLTLDQVNINDTTSAQGIGAFVSIVDSMQTVTLNNCKLTNSTIVSTAGARVGGLIGWTAGWDGAGSVETKVTVTNCEVSNCSITAAGSVGAIVGHSGGNANTFTKISNCVIKDNNLTSTDDGGWRVGVVVGTVNIGHDEISSITSSGNTVAQTGKTAPGGQSDLYGRFVPGSTGTLTIGGVEIH